jgi:hypothetical protein
LELEVATKGLPPRNYPVAEGLFDLVQSPVKSASNSLSFGNGAVGCGKFRAVGPWPLLVCFVLAAFSLKIIDFENVDFACRPRWFPLSGPNGLVEKIRHQGLLATANNH